MDNDVSHGIFLVAELDARQPDLQPMENPMVLGWPVVYIVKYEQPACLKTNPANIHGPHA
jgi:hypothetical protein